MNTDQITGIIRAVVPAVVAWLVGKGYIPGGSAADVSSALVAIGAAIWSIQNNKTGKTIT